MENAIDTLLGTGLISSIYFVDSNPAKVETVEIKKIGSEIKEYKKTMSFDLMRYNISKSGHLALNIRESAKMALICRLNFSSNMTEFKYFNRGFFRNLFSKRDPNKLADFAGRSEWMITSPEIAEELSMAEGFEPLQGYSDVRLVGKIRETHIYKIADLGSSIYLGNKSSLTAVFNRNISEDKYGLVLQYIIQANENLEKIMVH